MVQDNDHDSRAKSSSRSIIHIIENKKENLIEKDFHQQYVYYQMIVSDVCQELYARICRVEEHTDSITWRDLHEHTRTDTNRPGRINRPRLSRMSATYTYDIRRVKA